MKLHVDWICMDLYRFVWICMDLYGFVWNYHDDISAETREKQVPYRAL